MAKTILKLRVLLCFLMFVQLTFGVDLDYFFDVFLRSEDSCATKDDEVNCQNKCGSGKGYCLLSQCFCLTVSKSEDNGEEDQITLTYKNLSQQKSDKLNNDYKDYDEVSEYETRDADDSQMNPPEYLDNSLLLDHRPVLRHHIAHFCPNLEVARSCIRTCMKEGKPAFCGKDHVCYCGHRYSSHDRDPKVNVSSVYAQFKDLYEKYFGPNYRPNVIV